MIPRLSLLLPPHLTFGRNSARECAPYLVRKGLSSVFIVTSPSMRSAAEALAEDCRKQGQQAIVYDAINCEPSIEIFDEALAVARLVSPDAVVGLGGGSPLDVAKLLSALIESNMPVQDAFGIGKLSGRSTFLACLPSTAGTGSEVSPNAILLDESDLLKKGVVSPYLVPDATFVDPLLTVSMPAAVTAATGVDALTHCIEAYTNRFAHPMIDLYALEGIRLIGASLRAAVRDGSDLDARDKMALGSMYGGICLGPVNTAAVHALAYPLGGEFHVAHGVSNAVLLPHVMEFNLPACPGRYADVALALGATAKQDVMDTAREAILEVQELSRACGIPSNLRELNVPETAIPRMAAAAMQVTRLLKNNPRELFMADAVRIYEQAFELAETRTAER